ncbi:MAG: glycosyl hydrolase family 28 protein [Clostridiales bacterium]|nr:glycosyl hydrolase family 28 protein [Clostridiales bacterium]
MMNKTELRELILSKIDLPAIRKQEYSVLEFGVRPDSGEIQTACFQKAIDRVSEEGGGRLCVPAGRYRTGALRLKSGVELHLQTKDTILSFVNVEPEKHYPLVFSHWEATPCYNFSALIYACDEKDIALTGEGTLDGGADAEHWWNWHHQVEKAWSADKKDLQLEDRRETRRMNMEGVPVSERIFGPGHYLRPNFIQAIRCERVLLKGFTLKNSPMWQVNPVMCKSLTVDGLTLSSHGPNNDGCDPESCDGVFITNCRFDTGDDCISLKSGRDRDGREARIPCEHVLIEGNEFADGHGGIALGSEMSGGIRCVAAMNNRFCSPNLTYALRLKTNARRGGIVEDIVLADTVIDCVHGAAVHGTMLYEDGRNGDELPIFRNLLIENIRAYGGDYGVFLEAFDEVPITGLTLRNIEITGVTQPMRCMNWQDPVIENVRINGKYFPRPDKVRVLGITARGQEVTATARTCRSGEKLSWRWQLAGENGKWVEAGSGETFVIPTDDAENHLPASDIPAYLRVVAEDENGNQEFSHCYRILSGKAAGADVNACRLVCRGLLTERDILEKEKPIRRETLAQMLMPLANPDTGVRREPAAEESKESVEQGKNQVTADGTVPNTMIPDGKVLDIVVKQGFLALTEEGELCPEGLVSRQEMATVAMQACGVNYRNASSTMPVCADVKEVGNNYGTNVARALYFGFMELEPDGKFQPRRPVTGYETIQILNRVADFAGL